VDPPEVCNKGGEKILKENYNTANIYSTRENALDDGLDY